MHNLTEVEAVFVFATCPDCFWYNPAKVPKSSGLKTSQTVQFCRLYLLLVGDYTKLNPKVATFGLAYHQLCHYAFETKSMEKLTNNDIVGRAMSAFQICPVSSEHEDSDSD